MPSELQPSSGSKALVWIGRIISALPVLALCFSAYMKFGDSKELQEGIAQLGFPMSVVFGLGIVELACALIYAIPYTSVLGAILVTGYLGGAVAAHVRVGDPPGKIAAPIIIGVLVWLGLVLRDARLRSVLPLRL